MRTLAIGDIHGGLKALKQLLNRAQVTTKDTLLFLGDYVDGWSESAQTIAFLIELSKTHNCIFIKGNHDVWCEDFLKTNAIDHFWTMYGGISTIESYENNFNEKDKKKHLKFFEKMKLYHIDKNNRLFIHAGFTSARGPKHEIDNQLLYFDRSLWQEAYNINDTLYNYTENDLIRYQLFDEIYVGHTKTLKFGSETPLNALNVWNIDTGAGGKGKLSCIDINTKEVFQSDYVYKLYPNEAGRNNTSYNEDMRLST